MAYDEDAVMSCQTGTLFVDETLVCLSNMSVQSLTNINSSLQNASQQLSNHSGVFYSVSGSNVSSTAWNTNKKYCKTFHSHITLLAF